MKNGSIALEERLQSLFLRDGADDRREFVVIAGPIVYSYFVRLGVAPGDRDDLFQEVLLRVVRSREQYDPTRRLIPWLLTIAVNLSRSHHRKIREQLLDDELPDRDTDAPDALEALTAKETAEWLESQLHRLPVAQREAVILCCFEDIDQKEAASMLSIPEATLRTHLRRGRVAIAKALTRRNAIERAEVLA